MRAVSEMVDNFIFNKWDCVKYKGWTIQKNIKPIPDRSFDFDFWHENHDGENGLCGTASNVIDAINKINEIEL